MKTPIFVYGTLCHPQVVQTLLGPTSRFQFLGKASLPGYVKFPVKQQVFPAIVPISSLNSSKILTQQNNNDSINSALAVSGWLLSGLTEKEERILDWFEDEYNPEIVQVQVLHNDKKVASNSKDSNPKMCLAKAYVWKPETLSDLDMSSPTANTADQWSYDSFCQNDLAWYMKTTVRPCRLELERLGMT